MVKKEIKKADGTFETAANISEYIEEARVAARKIGCPNVNNVDPNYKGRSLL